MTRTHVGFESTSHKPTLCTYPMGKLWKFQSSTLEVVLYVESRSSLSVHFVNLFGARIELAYIEAKQSLCRNQAKTERLGVRKKGQDVTEYEMGALCTVVIPGTKKLPYSHEIHYEFPERI